MSRSRRPQCSTGRGCWVCGDAGKTRRIREADAARADAPDIESAIEDRHDHDDGYECSGIGCPFCEDRVDTASLPSGVTFTEAT